MAGRLLLVGALLGASWATVAGVPNVDPHTDTIAAARCGATRADVVIALRLQSGELRGTSDFPSVSVHADGCVRTHRPDYYRNPGDFAQQLSEAELSALLIDFSRWGAFEFRPEAARAERDAVARAKGGAELYDVGGADISHLSIALPSALAQRLGLSPAARQRFRWGGLNQDAAWYADAKAIRGLAQTQRVLVRMLDDARMKRVGIPERAP